MSKQHWVAVKELKLSCWTQEILLLTICLYYGGDLVQVPSLQLRTGMLALGAQTLELVLELVQTCYGCEALTPERRSIHDVMAV